MRSWRRTLPKAADLQRRALREARLHDSLTADFVRELDRSIRELNRRVRRLVLALETADGQLVSTQANLGRALQIRVEYQAALREAGFLDLAEAAVDEPLDRLAATALRGRSIANRAARLTVGQLDTLVAFKELRLAELLELGDDVADVLQRATLDGVLGSRPVMDLVDDLEDALDVTRRQARTIYDTSISTFSRSVRMLQATGEPDELFFYAGPADGVLRPFCRERVGKVFTRAQISAMSNGQLPNVLMTGGGYNCRHQWEPVSELDEQLHTLADTGERLGSIETQLEGAA